MNSESTRVHRRPVVGAFVLALSLAACADFSRGAPSAPAGDGGGQGGSGDAAGSDGPASDGASVSFATVVYPLLVPTCQRCHSAGNEAGDTQLLFTGAPTADYPTVVMFVDTSSPASSRMLAKMSGNGHGGGTVYAAGSPEYQTILQWIQQGAQP